MTDSDRLKRLLDAFSLGYAEGRQGKPEIPAPEDDASAALAREEIPTSAGRITLLGGALTSKAPVVTTGPRDENGNPEWVNFTTEPDEFDPGAEAAAIPFRPVQRGQLQSMAIRDAERRLPTAERSWGGGFARDLEGAWEEGFYAGQAYLAECCGCSGRGPEPANPYEGNHPGAEVRPWGEHGAVTVYRGL